MSASLKLWGKKNPLCETKHHTYIEVPEATKKAGHVVIFEEDLTYCFSEYGEIIDLDLEPTAREVGPCGFGGRTHLPLKEIHATGDDFLRLRNGKIEAPRCVALKGSVL